MARKKRSRTEKIATTVMENEPTLPIISACVEEDTTFKSLRNRLVEISQQECVTGYILRNGTSAAINLKDPSNLMGLALLCSYAVDTGHEFSETFNLGQIENIFLEGKNAKVLCVAVDKCVVNVFMEKTADDSQILDRIYANLD